MLPEEDYFDKYGPLIRILLSESDYDYLAATAGYSRRSASAYRAGRREVLRTYMTDLARDCMILVDSGHDLARSDTDLAAKLEEIERTLLKTLRSLRFRIFIEGLVPSPFPAPEPGIFRRMITRWLSNDQHVRDLLFSMNALGRLVEG